MIRQPLISYQEALSLILAQVRPVKTEQVLLENVLGRINSRDVTAIFADPGYDQSLRDGFVLGPLSSEATGETISYQLVGEIPAGRCDTLSVFAGEAYLILTGGMVPHGAERVVMQEECCIDGDHVLVPLHCLGRKNRYIQRRGSFIAENSLVLPVGSVLDARCVGLLAMTGNYQVELYRKVRVAFFCSGSELTDKQESLLPGQKVSSNRYLLKSLLKTQNATALDFGTVGDDKRSLVACLSEILESDADIIISTGGMGPGKYDLLEELFEHIGGTIHYRSLGMTPGRSTVFGTIRHKCYFGLPGPPSAVSVLFNELVIPGLRKMQGSSQGVPSAVIAKLAHDLRVKSADILCIKAGVRFTRGNQNYVRCPKPLESTNCFMHLEGKCLYSKDELIKTHVHLGSGREL